MDTLDGRHYINDFWSTEEFKLGIVKARNSWYTIKWLVDFQMNVDNSDKAMAKYLEMDLLDYQNTLIHNYRARRSPIYDQLYFPNKAIARKALEWVYTIIMSNEMRKY